MKKFVSCLSLSFIIFTVSAHTIWDVLHEKITLPEYIEEYNELKPVKQFEKFKFDCTETAIGLTTNAYELVYFEPKLTNVADGYATYIIPFRLDMKKGARKLIETIDTIKSTIPALNNSHLTPYDCKDLLPDGEYTGIEEDYIAFAILVDGNGTAKIATLKDDNIYIQLSVNYNGQTYSSELMNSVAQEVKISVPVDCELDNITAKFQSIYGELSFWDALISQKTPPEGYKRIQGNLKVLSNTEIDSDE